MADTDRDLILHWVLDTISEARVTDRSGHANHGMVRGTAALMADPMFGSCLHLSGGDDALTLKPMLDFPEREISICCWIKAPATSGQSTLLSYANDEQPNAFALFDPANVNGAIGNTNQYTAGIAAADGQ